MILAASFLPVVVWDDVVGRPFFMVGVLLRVQLEWGMEWLRRWGVFWAFASGVTLVSTRYCGLQVSGAPTWVAATGAAWRRAVVLVSRGGAAGWRVRVSWS